MDNPKYKCCALMSFTMTILCSTVTNQSSTNTPRPGSLGRASFPKQRMRAWSAALQAISVTGCVCNVAFHNIYVGLLFFLVVVLAVEDTGDGFTDVTVA